MEILNFSMLIQMLVCIVCMLVVTEHCMSSEKVNPWKPAVISVLNCNPTRVDRY